MSELELIIIWSFTIGLSLFRYFEEHICLAGYRYSRHIVSFIIGAMIPIIFLELLNDVYIRIHAVNSFLTLLLPTGFILSFLIEKHIYSHPKRKNKKKELHKMYVVVSSISAFFLGVIFGTDIQPDLYQEIILLVTFCLFHVMSSVYVHHIDTRQTNMHSDKAKRLLYGFSPAYGLTFALIIPLPQIVHVGLLALFSGAIIHVIVDDVMTEEKETLPAYFLLGAIIFTSLFVLDLYLL